MADLSTFIEDNCGECGILFRGQPEDLPLVPRLGRVKTFNTIPATESELLDDFKREAIPFLSQVPQHDLGWLALAQHHGIPTRLLDWTTNAQAALWFAVREPPRKLPGVVWVFRSAEEHLVSAENLTMPFRVQATKVFRPEHVSSRIGAQSGYFTLHAYLGASKRFFSFEELLMYRNKLTKLEIPTDCFHSLRFGLSFHGTSARSMFPGLDGLCEDITWRNTYLADEAPDIKVKKLGIPGIPGIPGT